MKALAFYLPQYHRIKENDEWWGEGYTEWTAVKNAVSYSKKQVQPRVPLNNNYYDLSDETGSVWNWQAKLAKKYNIYGFIIYHYWFETGKQLLEKPMEILLRHPEIDINYCICWANESWRRTWYGTQSELLVEQKYGNKEEWKKHFEYLLPFFKDERYIKLCNRPVVNIYHPVEIENLDEMIKYWHILARKSGFDGLHIVGGNTGAGLENRNGILDARYNFEPSYTLIFKRNKFERLLYGCNVYARSMYNRFFKANIIERPINGNIFLHEMGRSDPISDVITYPGIFPQWDNSPRRKYLGTCFLGMNKSLFRKQIQMAKKNYSDAEFIYINAWNEWGEGAYLEPDILFKYEFLEVIRDEFAV